MSIPGANELLEDMSPGWRRALYAAILAAFVVGSYFIFVDGRIAYAATLADHNSKRIDGLQGDAKEIKDKLSDIQASNAARDQQLMDMRDQMQSMNEKLDRLLGDRHRASIFP